MNGRKILAIDTCPRRGGRRERWRMEGERDGKGEKGERVREEKLDEKRGRGKRRKSRWKRRKMREQGKWKGKEGKEKENEGKEGEGKLNGKVGKGERVRGGNQMEKDGKERK